MDGIVLDRGVGWAAETPDLFSATSGAGRGGPKHHLVVEALPNGGWDWAAWAGDGSGRELHGRADSRASAMHAAECAAALLARTYHPARVPPRAGSALN